MRNSECGREEKSMPRVTVLMPVYNAVKFLRDAVDSILKQSFSDFEFLIIDDGSTDGSQSIIHSYDDSRIRLVQNEENLGVAATLNRGLDLAHGEYIARMDADDISMPHRLEKQIHFMEKNPEVGVSGTWIRLFGDQPRVVDRCPVGASVVKAYLLFDNPMFHPSVILRRALIEKHGLRYDPLFKRTEDFELWSRASEFFAMDNLPEVLLCFRVHGSSVTSTTQDVMTQQTEKILVRSLERVGIEPTSEELKFHHVVGRGRRLTSRQEMDRAESWLLKLQIKNREVSLYDEKALSKAIGMIWFRLCSNSTPMGTWIWKKCRKSSLADEYAPPFSEVMRFWVSMIWHTIRKMVNTDKSIIN